MKKKIECPKIDLSKINTSCDCNYVAPRIEKIEMKNNKKGELRIRLNGIGKWYPAKLDGNKLLFHA